MPLTVPSVLSVSNFDGRKLLIIMTIVTILLTVDLEISTIADFIPEQLASVQGIALFISIFAVVAVMQYYVLAFVKFNNKKSTAKTWLLHTMLRIVTVLQFTLVGIISFVILQILMAHQYNTVMLYLVLSISYGLWILTLGLLAKSFFSWYRSKKNLMVLISALAMVAYVINGVLGLFNEVDILAKRNLVIESGDVAVFPESASFFASYQTASTVSYVLTWIATVMLLRPYIEKIGRVKFWTIMGTIMAYYVFEYPLFALGYFKPSENSDAMINFIIFSLASVFTGIIFGAGFLSIARTLKIGTVVRNFMIITAYGFLLFYIAGSTTVSQAAYPPYGLISVSFIGLSCYLIYNGLYFSAISVSQDITLRQSIRKSVMEQSKLLDSIGTAEMEREVQNQVLTVAKKTSESMTDKTGIQASMNENDIKAYMQLVIKELKKPTL